MPQNIHKIVSVFLGLLFFSAPQFLFFEPERLIVNSAALIGYLVITGWYDYWYLRRIQKYNFWVLLRPLLLVLSGYVLLLVLPNSFLVGVFLVAFALLIAGVQLFLGNFAENVVLNETLVIAFGFLLGMFAVREYFTSWFVWAVAGTFVSTLLVTRSFYEFLPKLERTKLVSAGSIALFCSQLFWAMSLLPFHYSALAVILFNVFYFCIVLNYYAFFQVLNPKKIYFHVAFLAVCTAVILLFTPWKTIS